MESTFCKWMHDGQNIRKKSRSESPAFGIWAFSDMSMPVPVQNITASYFRQEIDIITILQKSVLFR